MGRYPTRNTAERVNPLMFHFFRLDEGQPLAEAALLQVHTYPGKGGANRKRGLLTLKHARYLFKRVIAAIMSTQH